MSTDQWVGGSQVGVKHTAPHGGGTASTGGGAVIQPLSSWYYYGEAGNLAGTLNRELTDQSVKLLHARAAKIASLGGSDLH